MEQKPKKQVETIASLKAEIKRKDMVFDAVLQDLSNKTKENESLKKSFDMVKANFEREKNRLDKTIDSLLNVTKSK